MFNARDDVSYTLIPQKHVNCYTVNKRL